MLERAYETTWITPIKFRITRVPITAAASGRKLIIVLYILFIAVLCSLFIVSGVAPMDQTCTRISKSVPRVMYIGYRGRYVKLKVQILFLTAARRS